MCDQKVELREVLLRHKPVWMTEASAKATVPVMCLEDGTVLDQSLEIMQWALAQSNDPAGLLSADCQPRQQLALIAQNDTEFKHWLDRYKYHVRYPQNGAEFYREHAMQFVSILEARLADSGYLFGPRAQLADIAIMPFVRQFCSVDRAWFTANVTPALAGWLSDWLEAPLFAEAMAKHPPWRAVTKPVYL